MVIPNAYALPFTAYEPHPEISGAYTFKPANGGNPILASGPEAERMRSLLDRAPPPADNRTALGDPPPPGEGAGFGVSVPDTGKPAIGAPEPPRTGTTQPPPPAAAWANIPGAERQPQQAAGTTPPPPPAQDAPPGPPAQPGAAPAPSPAQAPPGPHQGAASQDAENQPTLPGATPPGAPGAAPPSFTPDPYKRVAGVDPNRLARTAVAVPTAQSIQTEGGIQDPKLRAKMVDLAGKQLEAQAAQADVAGAVANQQYEQAMADRAAAEAEKTAAIEQSARASAAMDLVKQEGARRIQIAEKDLANENAKKVDQYALFKGNPGGKMMSMIGVALGQFGASMLGTQNVALQQLNREIDENIQEQREQIARGVTGKQNDLRRIMDQHNLDRDDAAQVLKLAYQKKVDAAAASRAALLGTQAAKLQYAAIQPKLMADQAATEAALNAAILGKVQINQQSKMMQPSAGGLAKKTDKELTEETELAARREKAKNAIAHGGIAVKEGDAAKEGEVTPALSRAAVSTDNALRSLHKLRKMVTTQSPISRFGEKTMRLGADTDMAAEAQHASLGVAGMEANGLAPDQARAHEIYGQLSAMNPMQQLAHLDALIDIAEKKQAAIRDISAKTAKIGHVGAYTEGGGGGEGGEP